MTSGLENVPDEALERLASLGDRAAARELADRRRLGISMPGCDGYRSEPDALGPDDAVALVRAWALAAGFSGTFTVAAVYQDATHFAVAYGPREALVDDDPDAVVDGIMPMFVERATGGVAYPPGVNDATSILTRLDQMTTVWSNPEVRAALERASPGYG